MANSKPIVYEQHPVSVERKAQLIAQGCKIIDKRFGPQAEKTSEPAKPKAKRKTRRG